MSDYTITVADIAGVISEERVPARDLLMRMISVYREWSRCALVRVSISDDPERSIGDGLDDAIVGVEFVVSTPWLRSPEPGNPFDLFATARHAVTEAARETTAAGRRRWLERALWRAREARTWQRYAQGER